MKTFMLMVGIVLILIGIACYKRRHRESAPGIWLDKTEHEIKNTPAVVIATIGTLIVAAVALLSQEQS